MNSFESDIIAGLIVNLEMKLMGKERIERIKDYFNHFKNGKNSDSGFTHAMQLEIVYVIEDYNNVINQAAQAIKSLQYENLNLKETVHDLNSIVLLNQRSGEGRGQNLNGFSGKNQNNDANLYDCYLNTEELQLSQNDNLFKLNYDYTNDKEDNKQGELVIEDVDVKAESKEREPEPNFSPETQKRNKISLRERIKSVKPQNNINISLQSINNSNVGISTDIIKITNEILKIVNHPNILNNSKYHDFLTSKYSKGVNDFKDFLDSLINYKFTYETLLEILEDTQHNNTDKNNNIENPKHHQYTFSEESFSNLVKLNSSSRINKPNPNIHSNPTPNSNLENNKTSSSSKTRPRYNSSKRKSEESKDISYYPDNLLFEKNLRQYNYKHNISTGHHRKPFNRFTRLHGNYFDKRLPVYSDKVSPGRSRSKSK